jgi:hypothetical protein
MLSLGTRQELNYTLSLCISFLRACSACISVKMPSLKGSYKLFTLHYKEFVRENRLLLQYLTTTFHYIELDTEFGSSFFRT